MSRPLSQQPAARAEPLLKSAAAGREPNCLVVSTKQERRRTMLAAAELAGWVTHAVPDAAKGKGLADRLSFDLVIVDLMDTQRADRMKCSTLFARLREALIVVCGSGTRVDEEIWARQLGVWLYLPASNSLPDLRSVCREARQIAGLSHSLHHGSCSFRGS